MGYGMARTPHHAKTKEKCYHYLTLCGEEMTGNVQRCWKRQKITQIKMVYHEALGIQSLSFTH